MSNSALEPAGLDLDADGRGASMQSVVIGGCFGWLHLPAAAASARTAVLLCPALRDEGLAAHGQFRRLAQTLAAAGYPTLRFDYPGTGDSCDVDPTVELWAAWRQSVHDAADWLRDVTRAERLAFCGLRLGALLAADAATAAVVMSQPCCCSPRWRAAAASSGSWKWRRNWLAGPRPSHCCWRTRCCRRRAFRPSLGRSWRASRRRRAAWQSSSASRRRRCWSVAATRGPVAGIGVDQAGFDGVGAAVAVPDHEPRAAGRLLRRDRMAGARGAGRTAGGCPARRRSRFWRIHIGAKPRCASAPDHRLFGMPVPAPRWGWTNGRGDREQRRRPPCRRTAQWHGDGTATGGGGHRLVPHGFRRAG